MNSNYFPSEKINYIVKANKTESQDIEKKSALDKFFRFSNYIVPYNCSILFAETMKFSCLSQVFRMRHVPYSEVILFKYNKSFLY